MRSRRAHVFTALFWMSLGAAVGAIGVICAVLALTGGTGWRE